jgi:hypothetical protein
MIVATVLYAIVLPFVCVVAMFSPMASDSGLNAMVRTFIAAAMSWPLGIVLSIGLGWRFFVTHRPRAMWYALAFPWLWLLFFAGFFSLGR